MVWNTLEFLIDDGGEFANESYKETAEQFNVEIYSTAAESTWQNGICKRNHAVIDTRVEKIFFSNGCKWFWNTLEFLIDDGGEFANESYKEIAEQFNVEIYSTAAEST